MLLFHDHTLGNTAKFNVWTQKSEKPHSQTEKQLNIGNNGVFFVSPEARHCAKFCVFIILLTRRKNAACIQ